MECRVGCNVNGLRMFKYENAVHGRHEIVRIDPKKYIDNGENPVKRYTALYVRVDE